jgi:SAM-dependent methyltransferase
MLELVTLDPEFHRLFNLLSMHQVMISDKIRMDKFSKAIFEVVKKGDIVVDVGTGTGILAFLAIKAGAKKVYAIEKTDMIKVAEEVAKANGWEDKIVFIHADSNEITLPEKADVVISETIGHMGLAENFLQNIIHARDTFLKPNGVMIPCGIEIYAAPVECEDAYQIVSFWNQNPYGIDFSPAARSASKRAYIYGFTLDDLLTEGICLASLNLSTVQGPNMSKSADFSINRNGTIHGFCGWFATSLTRTISLDSSPLSNSTHWKQVFLPLDVPEKVNVGDMVKLNIELCQRTKGQIWKWCHRTFNCKCNLMPDRHTT